MKILNVIEIIGETNIRTISYVISDLIDDNRTELDIVKDAEETFWKIALENGADPNKKDYCIEEGVFLLPTHDYKLFLVWSD